MANLFDDTQRQTGNLFDETQALPAPAGPSEFQRRGSDLLVSLGKGAIAVPEAAVGLGDLVSNGAIGKLAAEAGFTPKEWKANIESKYSPPMQADLQTVRQAQGFLPTLGEILAHPGVAVNSVIESIPGSLAGGAIGRGVKALGIGEHLATGAGEGLITAGQNAEQVRQESPTGELTPGQSAILAASGALTGAIGAGSSAVARRFGVQTAENVMVSGVQREVPKGMLGRTGAGAVIEGALEELPQSAQEQVAQNLAQGKPWDEGVGNAAAQGLAAGSIMGAAFNAPGPLTKAAALRQEEERVKTMPYKTEEAAQARANAMTTQTGQPHEIVDHPTVGGAFAVVPAKESENGTGRSAGPQADVATRVPSGHPGATPDLAGAEAGHAMGAGNVGQGTAAQGTATASGSTAESAGAGSDLGPGAVSPNAGPLERAAALAPSVPALPPSDAGIPASTDIPFTNLGAAKVDLAAPRLNNEHDLAAHEAASSPSNESLETPAMIDANNRKLGRSVWNGLKLAWENGVGTVREGVDENGSPWRTLMPHNYGFVSNTEAADSTADKKQGVDVVMGPNPASPHVFIVDQANKEGGFDEHKTLLGFDTLAEAKQGYLDLYQAGWTRGDAITPTTVDGFKDWLANGDTKQPFNPSLFAQTAQSPTASSATQPAAAGSNLAPTGSAPAPASALSQPNTDQPLGSSTGPSQPGSLPAAASAASGLPAAANAAAPAAGSGLALGLRADAGTSVGSLSSPDKDTHAQDSATVLPLGRDNAKSSTNAALPEGQVLQTGTEPTAAAHQATAAGVLPKELPAKVPTFTTAEQAQAFAQQQALDAEPVAHPSGGFVLRPTVQPTTPAQRAADDKSVKQLNRAIATDGVQVQAVHEVSPAQATLRAIVQRAFGSRVVYVTDNDAFDGVHHQGTAFINASLSEPAALIHTTFHELMHVLQRADRKLANQLHGVVKDYLRDGTIEQRIAAEDQAAAKQAKPGQPAPKLSKQQGIDEVMADVNGAVALDPKFWQALAQHDESLFRKVAYKFMELLTKVVNVARGSRYDIDTLVTNRAAVREAIAKGWAEYNASRKEPSHGQARQLSRSGLSGADRQPTETRELQEPGRVRGSAGVLARTPGPDTRDAPLAGLPSPVAVDGRLIAFGPYLPARQAAQRYMAKAGLPTRRQTTYAKLDPERGKAIAAEFDAMRHDPQDPRVKASYAAMIQETLAQYQEIKATGLTIEFIDYAKTGDPYGNPRNAILDVVNHNHLWVFSTRDGFGGPNATLDVSDNPLLAETNETISGQPALVNDIFRVVHDYFGHIKEGVGFRAEGEENAWQQHVRMYSAAAIPAMTSETRGQNSWVNFGPYGNANRNASSEQTEYATQKIGLMPEWTYTQGRQFARKLETSTNAEAAFQMASTQTFGTNREFKLAIQAHVQKAAKAAKISLLDRAYLHRVALQDALWAIQRNANAIGWYDTKVTQALNVVALLHPEILTDRQSRFAFTWALAVTSNGVEVGKNFELAAQAYAHYRQTGQLPEDIGIGKSKAKINNGMAVFNRLMSQWGFEATERLMTTKQTVRAIQQATGIKVQGEGMDTEVYGAAIVGPKIGNGFFANLYGHYEQLTMDRWFMRTWGRWTGDLVEHNPDLIKKNIATLKGIVSSMAAQEKQAIQLILGTRLSVSPTALAQAIDKASKKEANRDRLAALPHGDALRRAGINLLGNQDGQIESPKNSGQRNLIRSVMKPVLQELQQRYPALTMADLQALLWYPEKRLYDAAKTEEAVEGYENSAAPDYANAAVKLARSRGIDDTRIQDALRNNDETNRRPGTAGRGSGTLGSGPQAPIPRQYSRSGLDEPAGGPGDAGHRGSGALALRPQQADALPAQAVTHYGRVGDLDTLEASRYGQGLKGAEARRLQYATDQAIKQRVYFYLTPEDGSLPKKEDGLGPHVYTATLGNLYDFSKDPAGILPKIREIRDQDDKNNTMESLIVQAGYDGYTVKAYNMAVVLGLNVPVTYQGVDAKQYSRKPVFYSALQREVEANLPRDKQGMVSPQQAKLWLAAKAKEGRFKPDEVTWSGVTDFLDLQQGKVPAQVVADFVRDNGVRVDETLLGGSSINTVDEAFAVLRDGMGKTDDEIREAYGYADERDYLALAQGYAMPREAEERGTKYRQYTLPGGENYRELLITLPEKTNADGLPVGWEARQDNDGLWRVYDPANPDEPRSAGFRDRQRAIDNAKNDGAKPVTFRSSHFDEPNIVAHVRFNDRTDAEGNRVLFLEELQSDWAQQGKKNGFGGRFAEPAPVRPTALPEGSIIEPGKNYQTGLWGFRAATPEDGRIGWGLTEDDAKNDALDTLHRRAMNTWEIRRQVAERKTVPHGPFVSARKFGVIVDGKELETPKDKDGKSHKVRFATMEEAQAAAKKAGGEAKDLGYESDTQAWVALAVKRMIRYAADHGYDKIALVNGQQSADRYSLAEHVSRITWNEDKGVLGAERLDGDTIKETGVTAQNLDDYIGKEAAERLLRQPKIGEWRFLEGDDLKVGGSGMKAFYDRIVPNVINKLIKPYGAKLEPIPVAGQMESPWASGEAVMDELGIAPEQQSSYWSSLDQTERDELLEEYLTKHAKPAMLTQLGFSLTAPMKTAALDGQPQFSRKMPPDLSQVPGMTEQLAAKAGAWLPGQPLQQRWNDFRANFAKKAIQNLFDVFHPLKELSWHSYMLARMAASADGAVESILEYGKLLVDGSGALQNDRTGGVKQLLAQLQGEQARFMTWVIGNRADLLLQQGRENLFTSAEIAIMKAANQGNMPDGTSRALFYARMNRELQAFNKNVLDIAEQMGVIDGASRSRWEQEFYIPFYRLAEQDAAFMPTQVSGLTNVKGIVKLKGGKANLGDPLQNLVLNWAYLVSASLKNQAATFALREAEQAGVAHAVPSGTKDAIFILDNGKKEYFTVDDPFILTAISSIAFTGIKGFVIDAASVMKRALSFGVTINPSYMLRNLLRDQLQAPAANPISFNLMQNLVDGFKASSHHSPIYAQSLTAGGQYRMGVAYENNRAAELKRAIAKIDQSTLLDTPDKVKHFLAHVLDQYLEVGARAESITRSAIYAQAIAAGKSPLEAAFAARDSMDFGLQGAWPAVRVLAQTVPFFNARLQGLYKLGRAAGENPKRFALQLGAVTAATIALMLAYRDDDDWKQREEWDRDNFWWFKLGDKAYRIPKPFEIGAMASIAERGLELTLDGLDAKTAKRFGTRVERILLDNLSMNLTPQLVKPALDVYANLDPFKNRPIELPYEQESLTPKERIGSQTTALAQLLGKADILSPKQLDYLIQGYFGWLGGHLALATDFALRPAMGLPEKPTRKLADTFLLGEWVKELPARESRFVSEFYQQAADIKQAYGDLQHAKQLGQFDKAQSLVDNNSDKLEQHFKFNFAASRLANVNRRIRKVEAATDLSAAEKRALIDELTLQRNQFAEQVMAR